MIVDMFSLWGNAGLKPSIKTEQGQKAEGVVARDEIAHIELAIASAQLKYGSAAGDLMNISD
jgi:hypothetical protein